MCTRPNTAYENPSGGRPIFGWSGQKEGLPEIKLPCGKCPECQTSYYKDWASRGSRELARWNSSVFITLTYSEEHLPPDNSLKKKHIQDFIKRVKKHFKSSKENPIRQTYCGEYGTKTNRPHYHCVLYNCDFVDKRSHYKTEQGNQVYTSDLLTRLWGKGIAEFGYANPGAIAYIYKYILKKKTRREKLQPLIIERDGITYEVDHEFVESSRNPGIGANLRGSESLKKGFLSVNGVKQKIPKYYMNDLKKNQPEVHEILKDLKSDFALAKKPETQLRTMQREEAQRLLTNARKKL